MQVIKRDGSYEPVSFDKITKRISDLCYGLTHVDPLLVAKETINGIFSGIKTAELDNLSANICATKSHHHPEYNLLGGRILSSNIAKTTSPVYIDVVRALHVEGIVSEAFYNVVRKFPEVIQGYIDYERDYLFDFFAVKTLERSYLFKIKDKIVERPQHLWMRVAIQIHGLSGLSPEEYLPLIKETYNLTSTMYFTHATPTLFNAGTPKPQLSSCFLLSSEDNLEDIFKTVSDVAKISKWAGGIGLSLSNIRSKGSLIKGTNGKSEGIVPLCKTLEMVGRYINQGGKRQGSIAVYLEPWHADIYAFIELRKNTGDENLRARDLFLALWVPDLFMKRVQDNGDWSLMCPNECPFLVDNYGDEFEKIYLSYEQQNRQKKTVKARDLWSHILESQIETGMPYISYKDTVNHRNMQKQLGVIRNSNLCVAPETMILTSIGYYPIKTFEDHVQVSVWNGEKFTPTTVTKTGTAQELIKVVCSNGAEIECTYYHVFYVVQGDGTIVKHRAIDLEEGMTLIKSAFPVITDGMNFPLKHLLVPHTVPINGNLAMKVDWVNQIVKKYGYIDNDGFNMAHSSKDFLTNVLYLLQTLGCDPFLSLFDVGGKKSDTVVYRLTLIESDVEQLQSLGVLIDGIVAKSAKVSANAKIKHVTVKGIIRTGRISDTYCFTEKERGMGVFGGVLTGQCNEIALFSNKDNIAVCNLASICLPQFVDKETKTFDFTKLEYIAGVVCRNLNHVIDINFYPTRETAKTNHENRPIGIGIQGLADVYCMLELPFGSEEARTLNRGIFETIYYGAAKMSVELAKRDGRYASYGDSPHSQGLLQFDMFEKTEKDKIELTLDWASLKADMKFHGIRNSLLTALMPTASTSQIMGNNECFEPYTSNIYLRKTLAGEFTVVNRHLIQALIERGLWTPQIYEEILFDNGSVQKIKSIPEDIKKVYKTAYELKVTDMLKQAVDRSPFVDHMQSMNLFMAKPDFNVLNSSHFYSWKNGLKTGMYYLRTQPAVDAVKFGLDPTAMARIKDDRKQTLKDAGVADGVCPRDAYLRSICESCSA